MMTSTQVFETNAFDLHNLNEEHVEIGCRYTRLEKAIGLKRSLGCIVEAANSLVQLVLLHFVHEERFLDKFSLPSLGRQRDANIEMTAQLFDIEAGLEQEKAGSVSQLLLLGKVWMKEHMNLEREEFECEDLVEERQPFALSA